jgi:hypothetical protein
MISSLLGAVLSQGTNLTSPVTFIDSFLTDIFVISPGPTYETLLVIPAEFSVQLILATRILSLT